MINRSSCLCHFGLLTLFLSISLIGGHEIDNDFESGTLGAWQVSEESGCIWSITNYNESGSSIPKPRPGSAFLKRLLTGSSIEVGTALQTRDFFYVEPGSVLSLSFFMSSLQRGDSKIYIKYLDENYGVHNLLTILSSGPISQAWYHTTIDVPVLTRIKIEIQSIGNSADLVAIDDLQLLSPFPASTTVDMGKIYMDSTSNPTPSLLTYDFRTSVQGWTLSNTNGIRWVRSSLAVNPSQDSGINIHQEGLYSGYTEAHSPSLQTTESSSTSNEADPQLEITFALQGSETTPASLKIFQESAETRLMIIDLAPFGKNPSNNPITLSLTLSSMNNAPFKLVLEGYTGQTHDNMVYVSQLVLSGVQEIPFNPEYNVTSWTEGYCHGSHWIHYSNPVPIWTVAAGSQHPGMATLESLPLPPSAYSQKVYLGFKLTGCAEYPVELTLRKRTLDGVYDDTPFMDLRHFGSGTPDWTAYQAYVYSEDPYQIVLEGYIAAPDNKNDITINELFVESYGQENTMRRYKLV